MNTRYSIILPGNQLGRFKELIPGFADNDPEVEASFIIRKKYDTTVRGRFKWRLTEVERVLLTLSIPDINIIPID